MSGRGKVLKLVVARLQRCNDDGIGRYKFYGFQNLPSSVTKFLLLPVVYSCPLQRYYDK